MKEYIKASNWEIGEEHLTEIHLRITLFMKDKRMVQKLLIFDYHYCC
jgi:hypothetical protein